MREASHGRYISVRLCILIGSRNTKNTIFYAYLKSLKPTGAWLPSLLLPPYVVAELPWQMIRYLDCGETGCGEHFLLEVIQYLESEQAGCGEISQFAETGQIDHSH